METLRRACLEVWHGEYGTSNSWAFLLMSCSTIFISIFAHVLALKLSSSLQPFWHQKLVSWKTIFLQTRLWGREGDGFRMIPVY